MKLLSNKTLMILLIIFSVSGYIASCTHENEAVPEPAPTGPVITRGTNVHLPGNMTTGNPNEWKVDKPHGNVLWSTSYLAASGLLNGRFNQYGLHDVTDAEMINYVTTGQPLKDNSWAFYENEPAKTFFSGYVQTNTSNTGEARDTGCNLTSMGTTAIVPGTQNLTVTNIARIKTTEVKFDPLSNDYIVTFNFTWQGKLAAPLTKSIVGRLKYIPKSTIQIGTATAYNVFGLQLKFQFNCRDFGVTSTSIADKIDIEVNVNFHNK